MKVYEVIADENIAGKLWQGTKALAKAGGEKLMGKGLQSQAIERLEKELTDLKIDAVKAGHDPKTVHLDPVRLDSIAGGFIKKDPEILAKAEAKANAAAAKLGGISLKAFAPGNVFYKAWELFKLWGFTAASFGAWKQYYENVTNAEQYMNLPNGDPQKITQAQFDSIRREELTILIVKLVASLPAIGLSTANKVTKVIDKTPFLNAIPGVTKLTKVARGMDNAMLGSWLYFINSDTGKQIVVKIALFNVCDVLPLQGVSKLTGVDLCADLSSLVGGTAETWIDKLKSNVPAIYNFFNSVGSGVNTAVNAVTPYTGKIPVVGGAVNQALGARPDTTSGGQGTKPSGNTATTGPTAGSTAQKDKDATSQPAAGANVPSAKSEWPGGAPGTPGSPWQDMGDGEFINNKTGDVKFMPRGSKLD